MDKIKITQVKSAINRSQKQKKTLVALGLGRPNFTTEKPNNPQTQGMVNVVSHLVKVENLK